MSSTVRSLSPETAANMETIRKLSGIGQMVKIEVQIKDPQPTYTTLDRIEGTVSIKALRETSFDDIDIEFVGTSKTSVERLTAAAAVSGRSEAFHQFLKLQDKSVQEIYPEDRILEANKTYEFPFLFVIPEQLLPKVCGHACQATSVRDAHLQLPPSMGDHDCDPKDQATKKTLDDFVPEMVSTRYGVHVRISKYNDDGTKEKLANHGQQVRVVPATLEQPPLPEDKEEYRYRKEKVVRKGMLQAKAGTLVVEAQQPPPLRMLARGDASRPSTAKIILRFDPADRHAEPPRLGSLATKLKISTYFASTARHSYPTKQSTFQDPSQGIHTEQLTLAHRKVAGPEVGPKFWTAYESETAARRTSTSSSGTFIPDASTGYKNGTFYVAELDAPIILPENKAFVPTFHSCLISRIYQVKLELHLQNKGVVGTIDLKLPVQIACSADTGAWSPRRGSAITAGSIEQEGLSEDEVQEYLEPRPLLTPGEAFQGRFSPSPRTLGGEELPPSYSYYAPPMGGQTVPAY